MKKENKIYDNQITKDQDTIKDSEEKREIYNNAIISVMVFIFLIVIFFLVII